MNALLRSLLVVVGIPTMAATIYFGLFASDIYVSESRFAIRSAKAGASVSGLAAILSSPMVSGGGQDTSVIADYTHSQDLLKQVREKLDITSHYSNTDVDALSRLDDNATDEQLLEYFQEHVTLVRDSGLVNTLSTRIEEDALETARNEVERASEKVLLASSQMTRFQNANASLNPAAESSAILSVITGIESKLVEARAALSEKRAYMRDTSPEVITLKNRVNALSRQLRLEKGRVVGDGTQGQQMNNLIESYQPLVLEQEMAQQQYASALTSLEVARVEAQRKKQYLITFIQPNLPDEALEPRRLTEVVTVLLFSFLAYLIGGLMWSALKDHIGL